jgi:hypothetical protein
MLKHGEYDDEFPVQVFLGPDPDLALVHADLSEWMDAHPCDCEAICECDTKCPDSPTPS